MAISALNRNSKPNEILKAVLIQFKIMIIQTQHEILHDISCRSTLGQKTITDHNAVPAVRSWLFARCSLPRSHYSSCWISILCLFCNWQPVLLSDCQSAAGRIRIQNAMKTSNKNDFSLQFCSYLDTAPRLHSTRAGPGRTTRLYTQSKRWKDWNWRAVGRV